MRKVAAWVAERPQNSILVLATTLVLPVLQPFGGILLMMLALAKGLRSAIMFAAAAGVILVVVSLATGGGATIPVVVVVTTAVPVLLLAAVMIATRSLTLTLQLTALLAVVGVAILSLAVGNDAEFWKPAKEIVMELFRSRNLQQQVALFEANPSLLYRMLTLVSVLAFWVNYIVSTLLGHYLFQQLPENAGRFGRFCELNFGRIIAAMLIVTSVVSLLVGIEWMGNSAIVLFAIFTVQGLALMHWLHAEGRLPKLALVATYVLLLLSQGMLGVVLSVLGYLDALFDFRRRWVRA